MSGATLSLPRPSHVRAGRLRLPPTLFAVAVVLAGGAVAWARLPAVARDTLWAEDGRDFLQSAIDRGLLDALTPYGGYLHLVPRLIAAMAAMLPVELMALAMTAGSCLVAGLCAASVWLCARRLLSPTSAGIVAALTVLAPLGAREVLGNAANLHTLLMWTLLWLLLAAPRRMSSAVLGGIVALVAALSEIQAVFLLPLAIWRLRHPLGRIVAAGMLSGVAMQLVSAVLSPRKQTAFGHVEPLSYLVGFVANAILPLGLPQHGIGAALAWCAPLVVLGAAGAGIVLLALLLRRAPSLHRRLVAVLVAVAVTVFCGSVSANPEDYYDYARHTPDQLRTLWLARYGVLPSMLLAAALVVAAEGAARGRQASDGLAGSLRRLGPRLVVFGVIASMALHFVPFDTRRSHGPEWRPQVAEARTACLQQPHRSAVVFSQTLEWTVSVSCDLLRGD